jgi:serine/threonine-protein kinase
MTDQNQNPNPNPTPTPEQTKSGSSTILIVGIVVVVLAGLVVILFLIFGGGGSDTTSPPPAATAPIPPEATLPTPVPNTAKVTAIDVINVRSGPGTNYPSYGVAPAGTQGVVIGVSEDGGWWVVQVQRTDLVPDGQGWVSGEYVTAENTDGVPVVPSPEPPPVVEIPPPDPNAPKATALDAVNVRSGPGTSYPSYGIAPKGAQGEVIGISEDGQWWVVKLPTSVVGVGHGWVSADWVLVENAQGVPVIPAP